MPMQSPQGLVACDERVARMAALDFFAEQDRAAKKVHGVPRKSLLGRGGAYRNA
jgi:hypothetical protein